MPNEGSHRSGRSDESRTGQNGHLSSSNVLESTFTAAAEHDLDLLTRRIRRRVPTLYVRPDFSFCWNPHAAVVTSRAPHPWRSVASY